MDGTYTCERHDNAVVVYPQRVNGRNTPDCPLCEALKRVEELEKEVERLEDHVADLKADD